MPLIARLYLVQWAIGTDGTLTQMNGFYLGPWLGPKPVILLNPPYLYVYQAGPPGQLGTFYVFYVDPQTANLTYLRSISVPSYFQLAQSPNGQYLYAPYVDTSSFCYCDVYSLVNGVPVLVGTTTLPAGSNLGQNNIVVAPNGAWVYFTANPTNGGGLLYSVNGDGTLTYQSSVPLGANPVSGNSSWGFAETCVPVVSADSQFLYRGVPWNSSAPPSNGLQVSSVDVLRVDPYSFQLSRVETVQVEQTPTTVPTQLNLVTTYGTNTNTTYLYVTTTGTGVTGYIVDPNTGMLTPLGQPGGVISGTVSKLAPTPNALTHVLKDNNLTNSFAAMTPWHIFYRPCTNTQSNGASTNDLPSIMYCIDRTRTGYWSIFNYPQNTAAGASNPYFATVYPVDQNFYFGGGDGNVYCQPMRWADVNQALGVFEPPQFTKDDFNQNVVSVWRSRLTEQGDVLLQKQMKMWWGVGSSAPNSCSLTLRMLGTDGQFHVYTPAAGQNKTLPFEVVVNLQESQEQRAVVNYFLLQVQLTGSNVWLKGYGIVWRGVRYSGSYNLNLNT